MDGKQVSGKPETPGTIEYIASSDPLFFLPRGPIELFDYSTIEESEEKIIKYVRVNESSEFADFQDAPVDKDTGDIPYFNDFDRDPVRLKKPDFTVYNNVEKEMTITFLKKDGQGAYSSFSKAEDPTRFRNHYLSISVNNNNSDLNISMQCYDYSSGEWKLMSERTIVPFLYANEQFMFRLKALVTNKEESDDTTKDFDITAKVTRDVIVRLQNRNLTVSEKTLSLTYSPYQAWTLTEDGELVQGREGYLMDENGLYILEDGRRVDDKILTDNNYQEKSIRIGDSGVAAGLKKILGVESLLAPGSIKTTYENVYNELFTPYSQSLHEVVYQALQINACYKTPNSAQNPLMAGNNAKFYSIGTDETGIPIVVTQVGDDSPGNKKLVIAGPHGDERNAQRLIMKAQWYYTKQGAPKDTVLYFIPSISPTMAFADARGIPIVDKNNTMRSIDYALGIATVPQLHDLIAERIGGKTLRNHIQDQEDPVNLQWGVDANRDFHKKLPSTKAFIGFIDGIRNRCDRSIIRTTSTTVYDPNEEKEIGPFERATIRYLCFMMIHGYDSGGGVYGPYVAVSGKEKWPAGMSDEDKLYVNAIREKLGFSLLSLRRIDVANYKPDESVDDPHLYSKTEYNARKYQGEWSELLYNRNVWSVDIEMPEIYDEGRRNDEDANKEYKREKIVNPLPDLKLLSKGDNPFFNLVNNFPWH
jgi:hypothetical protein